MEHSTETTNAELAEPLLPSSSQEQQQEEVIAPAPSSGNGGEDGSSSCDHDDTAIVPADDAAASQHSNNNNDDCFSLQNEMMEMVHLGIPLAVSFFCRMVRQKTVESKCVWPFGWIVRLALPLHFRMHISLKRNHQPLIYREWRLPTRPL